MSKDMNSQDRERLQAEVDAMLKGLPRRTAPRTLLPRVMAAIQTRAAMPWHRQSWQMWPLVPRVASLAILLSVFGGLCLAAWKLPQADAYASILGQLARWLSGPSSLWNVLCVLFNAASAMARQLPPALSPPAWFRWGWAMRSASPWAPPGYALPWHDANTFFFIMRRTSSNRETPLLESPHRVGPAARPAHRMLSVCRGMGTGNGGYPGALLRGLARRGGPHLPSSRNAGNRLSTPFKPAARISTLRRKAPRAWSAGL